VDVDGRDALEIDTVFVLLAGHPVETTVSDGIQPIFVRNRTLGETARGYSGA
jgi:hypothetical protein